MSKLIVLFNLKADADARGLPGMGARPLICPYGTQSAFRGQFQCPCGSTGLFGTDAPAPYEYVEDHRHRIPWSNSVQDVSTETMGKVAGEFQGFADNPDLYAEQPIIEG